MDLPKLLFHSKNWFDVLERPTNLDWLQWVTHLPKLPSFHSRFYSDHNRSIKEPLVSTIRKSEPRLHYWLILHYQLKACLDHSILRVPSIFQVQLVDREFWRMSPIWLKYLQLFSKSFRLWHPKSKLVLDPSYKLSKKSLFLIHLRPFPWHSIWVLHLHSENDSCRTWDSRL